MHGRKSRLQLRMTIGWSGAHQHGILIHVAQEYEGGADLYLCPALSCRGSKPFFVEYDQNRAGRAVGGSPKTPNVRASMPSLLDLEKPSSTGLANPPLPLPAVLVASQECRL
jgi:hypothetical protein